MHFTLHPRLESDTTVLGDFPLSRVLLSKEALGPWIILVPRVDELREIHHLPEQSNCIYLQLPPPTANPMANHCPKSDEQREVEIERSPMMIRKSLIRVY